MQFTYPYTIENGGGESITFLRLIKENGKEYLEVENSVHPRSGPPMHVHHKQSEALTVVKGKIATQTLGGQPEYYEVGDTAVFNAGVPHKFWNAGDDILVCKGYIDPADNIVYFLSEIYKSTKANGGKRPGMYDVAYLLTRYKSEFDMLDIPSLVKTVLFPIILFFGKLSGKHKKFADAPEPV